MSCRVALSHCSDPALLWLWCRLAAAPLIWSLAWELPYAIHVTLKKKKVHPLIKNTIWLKNANRHLTMQGCYKPSIYVKKKKRISGKHKDGKAQQKDHRFLCILWGNIDVIKLCWVPTLERQHRSTLPKWNQTSMFQNSRFPHFIKDILSNPPAMIEAASHD